MLGLVWVGTAGLALLAWVSFRRLQRTAQQDLEGEPMEHEDNQAAHIVFEPIQCRVEVDELIEKFIGVESSLDLSDLKNLVDAATNGDRMNQAIAALKEHLTLPESDELTSLSIEEYVVAIEGAMREYVAVIVTAGQQGHDAVNKTEELLKQIDSIFSLVDGLRHIADQTGLLALNAAIEAARTGNVGRSYSYMAKEVQRLSEQSESFGVDIKKEMTRAKDSVEATTSLIDQMVVSDLHIALETRSSVDQLIGQLQGLAVLELNHDLSETTYSKIIREMHKIVVVVLMKIDLIQRLGLVDQNFQEKLMSLNCRLKSLYLAKVIKK